VVCCGRVAGVQEVEFATMVVMIRKIDSRREDAGEEKGLGWLA